MDGPNNPALDANAHSNETFACFAITTPRLNPTEPTPHPHVQPRTIPDVISPRIHDWE